MPKLLYVNNNPPSHKIKIGNVEELIRNVDIIYRLHESSSYALLGHFCRLSSGIECKCPMYVNEVAGFACVLYHLLLICVYIFPSLETNDLVKLHQ